MGAFGSYCSFHPSFVGKEFMGFTDLFIDYMPMYNKFRTVSSILVIAEFTIPLLAMLALKEIVSRPQLLQERKKEFLISFAMTGGLAFLFAVMPKVFFSSYVSTMEMRALQSIPANQLMPLLENLEEVRMSLFTSDAWRSVFIIMIGSAQGIAAAGSFSCHGSLYDGTEGSI